MFNLFKKVFDLNQKEVEKYQKIVIKINALEKDFSKLTDEKITKKSLTLRDKVKGENDLVEILPEAFGLVREAVKRVLGLRLYDVQLISAIALFEGRVSEQKTGEGKTLSAVPALYLRALLGKGAHLVTVNDYLARRDAGWNAPIFELLGLSTASIVQEGKSYLYDPTYRDDSHGDERLSHLKPVERREAYMADILYGTNNEFGFDYLRDNMVSSLPEKVQRGHYFAIVDEVDSILIDEARTPLIISMPDTEPTSKYYEFAKIVEQLNPDTDFKVDEKTKSATLTEIGISHVEKIIGVDNLYEKDFESVHHIENALRAKTLFIKDKDYIIKDDQVIIVDEFTGRLMFGRRWSDGLHQAVEAKEGVVIQQESKTMATISFQNYFRLYEHLSGMTGTASTEAEEFKKIYNLDVVVIPTNMPMIRADHADMIFKTLSSKYSSIVKDIEDCYKKGQPVLIGTTSIEKNELLSNLLKRKKIPHNVLNAKNHEKEANIIAEAGKPGAVTVATNMAGRGVDIILGGTKDTKNWEKLHKDVVKAGGLYVVGTERHESRRIDNQLRGRAGRQGDPGSSRFYLSLEDDLMRIFGGEQMKNLMDKLNIPDDQPIENRLISRAIEQAQVKVEGFNFDSRKSVVEYDDVTNQQRTVVYKLRDKILESNNLKEEVVNKIIKRLNNVLEVDKDQAINTLFEIVPFDDGSRDRLAKDFEKVTDTDKLSELFEKVVNDIYKTRENQVGEKIMREIERMAYLGSLDHMWVDHLDRIDGLKEGVRLRGYAQRDPIVEFKSEAFAMFEGLVSRIDEELSRRIFRISVVENPEIDFSKIQENVDTSDGTGLQASKPPITKPSGSKLGRNDPCWCGSGKKWKRCHYPQEG